MPDGSNLDSNATESPGGEKSGVPDFDDQAEMRMMAKGRLLRLGALLDIAESRSFDVKDARECYNKARNELYRKKDALESITESEKGNTQLTQALNKEKYKLLGFPKWNYISFSIAKYGLFSLSYGMISAAFFGSFLLFGNVSGNLILGVVPLWAALIAGLGTSAQIMVGTVEDIKDVGIVKEYKRLWYIALPFLGAIFGFIAYILVDLGVISLTGSAPGTPVSNLYATNISGSITITELVKPVLDNTTLTASAAANLTAEKVGDFKADVSNNNMRMAVCFIVGYATNAFIDKLTKLSKNF
ncbi:MAG: hypothetical protein WBK88_08645 [Methanothrix sp.]